MLIRITKPYLSQDNLIYLVFESLLILSSALLAHILVYDRNSLAVLVAEGSLVWQFIVLLITTQGAIYYNDLYSSRRFTRPELVLRIVVALLAAALILNVCYYFLPKIRPGRMLFVVGFCLTFLSISMVRIALFHFSANGRFNQRVLILGSGQRAAEVAKMMLQNKSGGYTLLGMVSMPPRLAPIENETPVASSGTRVTASPEPPLQGEARGEVEELPPLRNKKRAQPSPRQDHPIVGMTKPASGSSVS